MKKQLLFTLAFLFLMGTASKAQSFQFQYEGTPVADGGMVTIEAVEDEFGFGELWCETNPPANPDNGLILKLLSGTAAAGTATITIDENTMNPTIIKWCMGGNCIMFNGATSLTKDFSTSNGIVQAQFDAENAQQTGYLLATLTATIGSETHRVRVQFTNGASTGIAQQLAPNTLHPYYDLSGRRVDNPTKGLYITNGKKVIIK